MGKNMPTSYAPGMQPYAPQNTAAIDSNRPGALEKCIDGSLNSKKPWRTVRLGANLSPNGGAGTQYVCLIRFIKGFPYKTEANTCVYVTKFPKGTPL